MDKPVIKDFGASIGDIFQAIDYAETHEEDGEKYRALRRELYGFYIDHKEIEREETLPMK